MSLLSLLRLGLRQFAAGMLSVLALGILNRVMKVELGVELGLVGLIIGAHYFTAPLAVPIGHRSDYRPYFGLHRTPYILAGAVVVAACTALTPFVAFFISAQGGSAAAVLAGIVLFLCMGSGMYIGGAAYLSLISDLTAEHERGKAVGIVWSMLMGGILAGVFLSWLVLGHYSRARLVTLFLIMAGTLLALTVAAVWGREPRRTAHPLAARPDFARSLRLLLRGRQTASFFVFLTAAIFCLFLQQAILEPFGADDFGMSVRETTSFNGSQMVGVLLGMAFAGAWLARRMGMRGTAALGLVLSAAAFLVLATAGLTEQPRLVHPAILLLGLGMGLFNIGGLSLMMDMSVSGRVGLFMGVWTLSESLANGLATAGGGLLYEAARSALGSQARAYAAVFALEALGLLAILALLRRISVVAFRMEQAAWVQDEYNRRMQEPAAVAARERQ